MIAHVRRWALSQDAIERKDIASFDLSVTFEIHELDARANYGRGNVAWFYPSGGQSEP